jgi:hypothetical protein
VEENRDTRWQDLNRAQTSKRGDPPHHCAIFWLEVSHVFLCTLITPDAVALSLSRVEPHLRYGKLATSNIVSCAYVITGWITRVGTHTKSDHTTLAHWGARVSV